MTQPKMDWIEFLKAANLKKHLPNSGITDIAKEVGKDRITVSRILDGEEGAASTPTIYKVLCAAIKRIEAGQSVVRDFHELSIAAAERASALAAAA